MLNDDDGAVADDAALGAIAPAGLRIAIRLGAEGKEQGEDHPAFHATPRLHGWNVERLGPSNLEH